MEQGIKEVISRLDRIEWLLGQLTGETGKSASRNRPLTMTQAAAYLQLSQSRIYSLIYEKQLKPIQRQKGSKIFFTTQELDNYQKQGGSP